MESVELDVLSQGTNRAVVQMPGRRFPGIVIQGDTLSNLVAHAESIVADLREGRTPIDEAVELSGELAELLDHYAQTLAEHGVSLPYFRPEA